MVSFSSFFISILCKCTFGMKSRDILKHTGIWLISGSGYRRISSHWPWDVPVRHTHTHTTEEFRVFCTTPVGDCIMTCDTNQDWCRCNHDEWKAHDMSLFPPHLINGLIYCYLVKKEPNHRSLNCGNIPHHRSLKHTFRKYTYACLSRWCIFYDSK